MARYFSDRERGERPRTKETIDAHAWAAIFTQIDRRIDDGSFGFSFPALCDDGYGPYGTDQIGFWAAAKGDIPTLIPFADTNYQWRHANPEYLLDTMSILDFIEFCYDHVAEPIQHNYHDFFKHWHLRFDREQGRSDFLENINRIFSRNGIAFSLETSGQIIRLAPEALRPALTQAIFATGDGSLDQLLEAARAKFLSPIGDVRGEALEKLWDAFERLKTIEPGRDKKAQAKALLARIADAPRFCEVLDREAVELTAIGNSLHIRHSETNQEEIQSSEHVDYLFHRLFAFIRLALRQTGRGG